MAPPQWTQALWARTPLLLLALVLGAMSAAAASYDPALWNQYNLYEATKVPEALLFGGNDAPALFPLDFGYGVEATCNGPRRPFPSPAAAEAPGACEYQPIDAHTYNFWQKLPGDRLRLSNCYCYSLDRYEGAWCFPGEGSGQGELQQDGMTCSALAARVASDGGAPVPRSVAVDGPLPSEGHFISLHLRTQESCDFPRCGPDFHLMRRDDGGKWSHKPGEAAATDRDADGEQITDPQAARINGAYTSFCGYFHVVPARMRVGTQRAPDRVTMGLQRWRDAGLAVTVSPLPYDPSRDAGDEAARLRARDAMLQLQRGDGGLQQQQPEGEEQGEQQPAQQPGQGQQQQQQGQGQGQQQPQQMAAKKSLAQSGRKLLLRGA